MIKKLQTVDAFIVFDLGPAPEATAPQPPGYDPHGADPLGPESVGPESVGIVRSARKILVGGASDLARSQTYAFATFGMRRSGASAGINATDETRADAIARFTSEIAPMVASGRFMPESGTRVPSSTLQSLVYSDPRANTGDIAKQAKVSGVVAAASFATGGLEGRSAIIEGFDNAGLALANAVMGRGAKVVAVCAGNKSVIGQNGLSADALSAPDAGAYGNTSVAETLATPADVLFAGSTMGAISHTTASQLNVGAVVPHGPIPVTAKALATLNRAGTTVVPDFISTAGPLFAWWPSDNASPEAIPADAISKITSSLQEIADHPDGLFLAACYRAEAFLATWQDTLPFGRPLAP